MKLADGLQGKVALVTGGTSGVGLEAARGLAAAGAEVILVGRDRGRSESAVADIIRETGNTRVDYLLADLSSQVEVRRLAAEFLAREQPLHILLNNAGALFWQFEESVDGIEMTWALNHLAYFLLTDLLLERLRESAPARIVNVASRTHKDVRGLNFDDLEGRRRYARFTAYGQSKLANILFTRELAQRLKGSGITVNALHPGFVGSRFGTTSAFYRVLLRLPRPFPRSPAQGAETAIDLCSSPEVENVSGEYFVDCRIEQPASHARDDAAAARLWQVSEAMTAAVR